MPEVAEDSSSATLTAWLVTESDDFAGAQSIATVETASSLLSIEVSEPGVLIKSLVEPGQEVQPGSPLAVLGAPGEVVEDVEDLMGRLGLAVAPEAQDTAVHLRSVPPHDPLRRTSWAPHETEPADAAPQENETGRGHPAESRAEEQEPGQIVVDEADSGEAAPHDLEPDDAGPDLAGPDDLGPVAEGTEPVVAEEGGPDDLVPVAEGAEPVVAEEAGPVLAEEAEPVLAEEADTVVARPVVAWAETVADAVVDAVVGGTPAKGAPPRQVRLRDVVRAERLVDVVSRVDDVSLMALLVKAVATTTRQVPMLPGQSWSVTDVAVQRSTGSGTVAPVVHVAGLMSARSLTSTLDDLDTRAQEGRIAVGELEHATVTVVDLGPEGATEATLDATSVHPAVVTIGSVREQPVVEDGAVVPGRVLTVTLACDADRIAAAAAARWLAHLVALLEEPLRFLT